MRIIKYGKRKLEIKRFECGYCDCIFEAEPSEYKTSFNRNIRYIKSECPCCGLQVIMEDKE